MKVVVFEDRAVAALGPGVAARPACDLSIGTTTLAEWLAHFGPVRRAVRPHLARHLAALDGCRDALWGSPSSPPPPARVASSHGGIALVVNARVTPSRENITVLRGLVEAGRRAAVHHGDTLAAALLHLAADGGGPDDAALGAVLADPSATAGIDALALPRADAALELVSLPHDLLSAHERAIEGSLAMRIDSGRFQERRPGLFVAAGADVAAEVVVRHGPVVVDEGASIGPFVCLDGPIWIGRGTRVNPHAWIRAATSVGHDCRIGGEVEATVFEPFSNKAHGGFLGHSHVGSWVNIAAGTVTSNLKATYGPVRLHRPRPDGGRDTTHTNRQFMGALVGELVRTGINASIPCGARIGVAAAVGGDVAEQVPAFANRITGGPPGERSTADQAAIVLGRMMARRGLPLLEADRRLLEEVRSLPEL